jgi:hypothetical protein
MWKKAVVAEFRAPSWQLTGHSGKPRNTAVMIAGFRADIWPRDLPSERRVGGGGEGTCNALDHGVQFIIFAGFMAISLTERFFPKPSTLVNKCLNIWHKAYNSSTIRSTYDETNSNSQSTSTTQHPQPLTQALSPLVGISRATTSPDISHNKDHN